MKQPGRFANDSSLLKCQFCQSFHKDMPVSNDSERSAGGRGRVGGVPGGERLRPWALREMWPRTWVLWLVPFEIETSLLKIPGPNVTLKNNLK